MSIKAPFTKGEGFEREIVPAGNHVARVYSTIHIGKVEEEYMGEIKYMDKVRIGFELPNELRTFGEKGELPMVISQEYTLSLNEKAKLRHLIEGMLGATLDEAEEYYGVESLIGRVCLLNVIQKTSKKGKQYAVIISASPLPKGMEAPKAVNEPFILDYEDNWSDIKFRNLPDFLTDKMRSSEQYKKSHETLGDALAPENAPKDDFPMPTF